MKIDRTRASRKAARRYNVSPVARAVRSVLTISAAALMFSGTGVVLAKSPVVAPLPIERASLSHEFAKVVDLTRVADEWTPKSVVDEEFESFAAPMGVAQTFAASATVEAFGLVDDLTVLPGSFHPGPGGVSGSDDFIGYNAANFPGTYGYAWGTATGTSTTGFADGFFVSTAGDFHTNNHATIDVTGYTWAAGFEVETGGNALFDNNVSVSATATGYDSIAFGVYQVADGSSTINNNSTLNATASGESSTAIGAYALGFGGDASTTNSATGTITATGSGLGSDATGMYAASLDGNASGSNAGTITVSADSGNAIGGNAFSIYGDATQTNTGTLVVSGYNATGLYAYSIYGDALVDNDGTLKVDGTNTAQGGWAKSYYGNATVDNGATGVVNVNGTYGAAGLIAGAYYGTATVANAGSVSANSDLGVARGVFAYGDSAVVTNAGTGTINANGNLQAIAIDAEGLRGATVTNDGALTATSNGDAIGVWATSYGDSGVTNNGSIDVDAINGIAYGVYAGGYNAYVRNFANIDAASVYGDAIGVGVGGVYAFAQNDGLINANGGSAGVGMFGYGVVSANLNNTGTINATASATDGFAAGILAVGDAAGSYNGGTITAVGAYATGIDIRATSDGSAVNVNQVIVRGGDVTGISVRASGEGGTANVLNYGVVDAEGDLFAVGVAAVARGYLGTASVYNGGSVYASAKYGSAQGIVASADMDASVDNQGSLVTLGGDSAYGILALSADGDVTVDNGFQMATVASNRGYGIAYGIAAQSNNGLVTINNDGQMITVGDSTAMGIYASTKWNDVEVTNSGQLYSVSKYGGATGAIAITYTGDANVSNGEYGQVMVQGGYSAGGLRAISLYGDANVTNDGDVQTTGGVLDRGLTARSLYGGTATITNNGTISTEGGYSSYGVWARSDYGDATVNNIGGIESYSAYGVAYGALAGGAYTISIDNSGDIRAYAADTAAGVLAYSVAGDATVVNSNYLLGVAGNAAYGAQVIANAGTATLTNTADGRIVASGYNVADAVFASGAVVNVTNDGTLIADADGWAAGIEAVGGDINLVSNTGADISAYAYSGRATGMFASADGDATVRNGGAIDAESDAGDAFGTFAQAGGNAVLTNGGALNATSHHGNAFGMVGIGYNADLSQSASITVSGYGTAVGIEGVGYAHANIINNGDVSVTAVSGIAAGLYTYSVHDTRQVNNGTIDVHAGSGRAFGMYAYGFDDVELVNRAGRSITASVDNGTAYGMYGYGGRTILTNDGAIDVTSGDGAAIGMLGFGYETSNVSNGETGSILGHANQVLGLISAGDVATGSNAGDISVHGGQLAIAMQGAGIDEDSTVSLYNTGTLYANVSNKYGTAAGMVGSADGDVHIDNANAIDVRNGRNTYGVQGRSEYGTVSIDNSGAITSYGTLFNGAAFGIEASGYGGVSVDSSGSIVVEGKYATGIRAISEGGDVTVDNSGSIEAGGLVRQALGILAITDAGDATVTNSHSVTIEGTATGSGVTGIIAGSYNGTATIHNVDGATVTTTSEYGNAGGLYAFGPDVTIDNGGDVLVSGGLSAVGVGFDSDHATIVNGGTITVAQTGGSAPQPPTLTVNPGNGIGIAGYVGDGGSAHVTNDGSIDVAALDYAFGIKVDGAGDVTIDGTGSINVGGQTALGIYVEALTVDITTGETLSAHGSNVALGVSAYGNEVAIHNAGTTDVYASFHAVGLQGIGIDDVAIDNSGDLLVYSYGHEATGISALSGAHATVDNAGDISVSIGQGGDGEAFGIHVRSGGYGAVVNGGTITVDASAMPQDGLATGIFALGEAAVNVDNTGDITVTGAYTATGAHVWGLDASFHNAGDITATGRRAAVGAHVDAGTADFDNAGDITAHAYLAYGVLAFGDDLTLINGGDITATAELSAIGLGALGDDLITANNTGDIYAIAYQGDAIGAFVQSYGNVDFVNGGSITAHAAGETIGLEVRAEDAHVTNSGLIGAVHQDYAIALDLDVVGNATVDNVGDIVAQASEEGSIAIHGGDGFDLVTSSGSISGALLMGAGDDRFTNAAGGTWIVRGHATDFGDGDDAIVNGGTIVLHDAAISLGGNSATGNSFANNGLISVRGDSLIDMGTGSPAPLAGNNAPIDVLNPVAFTNNGTISFLDGAPDDVLTVTGGDFAGQGALDVDVSLLHGTSDMLYIDGNIASTSVQTLNVNVLDLLTSATEIDIPVVVVEGESTESNVQAGNIIAGNVNFNANNFLDLKVGVKTHLNADNSSVDMFSLTLGFGGLNDTGAIATAIAPGAHSLMAAQVGTFRQRMGVFSQLGDSDKGAWVRVFGDKGSITPDAQLDNLPATNNFAFDQTNQGVEAGVNALVTDGFFIGASLSKSRGKQDLSNGFGSDDIDGTTVGGYVTWLGQNGMYADVSYRWMHFDADMTSFGGQREVGGDAGAINAELGWNVWTSAGGMKLVPQVQYTRTKVENIDRIEGDLADFVSEGGTSSRARLGLEMEQTFQSASGTKWTPYGVVSIVREFDGETSFTVADTFSGRMSTEGTSGQLEFGVNAKIGERVDVWGGLNYLDGGAIDGVWGGQLGIRYTW
ncbi:hypothetical protein [Noviluteimonas gilva]|uniref:Autotransporter domain-containing protein n=1 Tax=Noviluteimonas gilva TaxID=2682097 RepID=A0A7C9LM74_9GAMM|nr:hypothetical protein [Lysobacter gilvus]MUV13703.1 hypothetical protein [Lysobacter gilvus]